MNAKAKKPPRLKAWNDPSWQRKLTQTLTVSRVDEDIPTEKQGASRKPWYIALTQGPGKLARVGRVDGLPAGNTLLLSEDDVIELVRYLVEPQTAVWSDNPNPTEPGEYSASFFIEPGMVVILDSGHVVNGEAHWSPEYFGQQEPVDVTLGLPISKVHTLPWKRPPLAVKKVKAPKSSPLRRKRGQAAPLASTIAGRKGYLTCKK